MIFTELCNINKIIAFKIIMNSYIYRKILFIILLLSATAASAQDNDRIKNRPYVDNKMLHFGFSVGVHTQDFQFTHSGYATETGETWFMEVPNFSPAFNVTIMGDWRMHKHFNLRLSPGMCFGNKVIKFHDTANDKWESQNVKTSSIIIPLEVKASAERYRNMRPYVTAGIMGTFDLSKKRSDFLKFKSSDVMITVGFGCDFYLPFFKLVPELKFCFGLTDILDHKRPDLSDEPETLKYTNSLKKVTQQMVILSFYFE